MAAYFEELVGQENLKRKLSFYLDAFRETMRMPFLLFGGARGLGKTKFARETAKNLLNKDGSQRPLLEVNCSILKNIKTLFEGIYIPYIANSNGLSILWDESHALPVDISQALLTICNSDPNPVRNFTYEESTYSWDFTKLSFMFATTESDKLFPPLKDRFETVDFQNYKKDELKKIIAMNADETVFKDNVLDSVADNVRGNARSCVKMAENITTFCKKNKKAIFGAQDWESMKYDLGLLPFGLTNSEAIILRELLDRGPCSLNMLASATGMSRTAIQYDAEQYLLRNSYMKIDGKRMITKKGQEVLKLIK